MNSSSEISAFANIHAQLASIMEILARSAVTEISKLVNDSTEVLLLEMCRRQNENDSLKRKLEWMEMELRSVRNEASLRSFMCARTIGVQAGDGFRPATPDKLHFRRRSAHAGKDFDQQSPRLWANGGPPAVQEEASRLVSGVESVDFERGSAVTPLVKEEGFEEMIDNIDSRRGVMIITAVSGSGPEARDVHPVVHQQLDEEHDTQLAEGSEEQEVQPALASTSEDLRDLEEGKQQRALKTNQTESQDCRVRSFGPDSACDTNEKGVPLWTSAVQRDSETETDDPDFPYDTEQSLSDVMEVQSIPAADFSIATKSHFGLVGVTPKKEETVMQPECSEGSKSGVTHSQLMEYRERLGSVMTGDGMSTQREQRSADCIDGTKERGGKNFTTSNAKTAKTMNSLTKASKGEKQISCVQCGKSFTTRFYLKIHLRIHTETIDDNERCTRLWEDAVLTEVKEEAFDSQSTSMDTERGGPKILFIKEERQDESDYTDSQGGLMVTTAANGSGPDAGKMPPIEYQQCERESDTKPAAPVGPGYQEGLSSVTQLLSVPAPGEASWADALSSRNVNVKSRFGVLGVVLEQERLAMQPGCSEGSAFGVTQSQQMECRERLGSVMTGDVMSTQQEQRSADCIDGTKERGGKNFIANKAKTVNTMKMLKTLKEVKQFSCTHCGKSFSDRFYLKIHQRIHTGERPFSCTQCEKSYYCTSHLIAHQRTHTGEKPYKCHECGNSYSYRNSLKLHQQSHTGEKPYSCAECGKAYCHLNSLKLHQKTHTGEKPYKCNECGKSYCHLNSLKVHRRSHTGEKPYSCEKCGNSYSHPHSLKFHEKSHDAANS